MNIHDFDWAVFNSELLVYQRVNWNSVVVGPLHSCTTFQGSSSEHCWLRVAAMFCWHRTWPHFRRKRPWVQFSQCQIQISSLFDWFSFHHIPPYSTFVANLLQVEIPVAFASPRAIVDHSCIPTMELDQSWSQATEIFFNYSSAVTSVVTGITPERSAAMSALELKNGEGCFVDTWDCGKIPAGKFWEVT